jgi:hypothetical protein
MKWELVKLSARGAVTTETLHRLMFDYMTDVTACDQPIDGYFAFLTFGTMPDGTENELHDNPATNGIPLCAVCFSTFELGVYTKRREAAAFRRQEEGEQLRSELRAELERRDQLTAELESNKARPDTSKMRETVATIRRLCTEAERALDGDNAAEAQGLLDAIRRAC